MQSLKATPPSVPNTTSEAALSTIHITSTTTKMTTIFEAAHGVAAQKVRITIATLLPDPTMASYSDEWMTATGARLLELNAERSPIAAGITDSISITAVNPTSSTTSSTDAVNSLTVATREPIPTSSATSLTAINSVTTSGEQYKPALETEFEPTFAVSVALTIAATQEPIATSDDVPLITINSASTLDEHSTPVSETYDGSTFGVWDASTADIVATTETTKPPPRTTITTTVPASTPAPYLSSMARVPESSSPIVSPEFASTITDLTTLPLSISTFAPTWATSLETAFVIWTTTIFDQPSNSSSETILKTSSPNFDAVTAGPGVTETSTLLNQSLAVSSETIVDSAILSFLTVTAASSTTVVESSLAETSPPSESSEVITESLSLPSLTVDTTILPSDYSIPFTTSSPRINSVLPYDPSLHTGSISILPLVESHGVAGDRDISSTIPTSEPTPVARREYKNDEQMNALPIYTPTDSTYHPRTLESRYHHLNSPLPIWLAASILFSIILWRLMSIFFARRQPNRDFDLPIHNWNSKPPRPGMRERASTDHGTPMPSPTHVSGQEVGDADPRYRPHERHGHECGRRESMSLGNR